MKKQQLEFISFESFFFLSSDQIQSAWSKHELWFQFLVYCIFLIVYFLCNLYPVSGLSFIHLFLAHVT